MRLSTTFFPVLVFTTAAFAQDREIGAGIGFGFYRDVSIANANGAAQAGFGPRFALSAAGGFNWADHFGAEARYTFQDGDLALQSGSRQANLDGEAHSLLGEMLFYATARRKRFRPFAAAGFGVKLYRGTEVASGVHPLTEFATLQTANQARPLFTFGGGLKYAISERWLLRLDLRDYLTPFPTGVIAPAPGSKFGGWLHDFVPVLGIGRTF